MAKRLRTTRADSSLDTSQNTLKYSTSKNNFHPIYTFFALVSVFVLLTSILGLITVETSTIVTTTLQTTTKHYRFGDLFHPNSFDVRIVNSSSSIPPKNPSGNDNNFGKNVTAIRTNAAASTSSVDTVTATKPHAGLFRNCTSPEASVSWLFHPEGKFLSNEQQEYDASRNAAASAPSSLLNPHLKCGFGLREDANSKEYRFLHYFETIVKTKVVLPILKQENCHDLVVFGAAFGESYIDYMRDELLIPREPSQKQEEWVVNPRNMIARHGRCFFMFVNGDPENHENDLSNHRNRDTPKQLGHYWMIPLRPEILPYRNPRRNAKLVKYLGHSIFLNNNNNENNENETNEQQQQQHQHQHEFRISPKVVIWQDAKFFRNDFVYSIPRDYAKVLTSDQQHQLDLPCLTTMGLPVTKASFGKFLQHSSLGLLLSSYPRPRYRDHCHTIIDALENRPDVTDSPESLMKQCHTYMDYVMSQHHLQDEPNTERRNSTSKQHTTTPMTDSLDIGLIDSAFLVWNEGSPVCRDFNAMIRCTMLDQLQCHSDRDQVLFPLVMHRLLVPSKEETAFAFPNLKATYYNSWTKTIKTFDAGWKPHAHDLDFVIEDSSYASSNNFHHRNDSSDNIQSSQVYVRIQRSACHWYYYDWAPNQPMGERECGHKIWLKDNLEYQHPSIEQEKQILMWASPLLPSSSSFDDNNNNSRDDASLTQPTVFPMNATTSVSSLAAWRGNQDAIEKPYAADFQKCTSPEYERFQLSGSSSRNEDGSCIRESSLPFFESLQQTVLDPLLRPLANNQTCSELVVFGTVFDGDLHQLLLTLDGNTSLIDPTPNSKRFEKRWSKVQRRLRHNHGNCFFLFVLQQDGLHPRPTSTNSTIATEALLLRRGGTNNDKHHPTVRLSSAGHYWIVPVDREILPYESMKRNSKLFQYTSRFLFPFAKSVIYHNSAFLTPRYLNRQPTDYNDSNSYHHQQQYSEESSTSSSLLPPPCLMIYSLPKTVATVGATNFKRDEKLFQGHCKHVINRMEKFTNDGASTGKSVDPAGTASLIQQCDAYLQYVYRRELDTSFLDQGMADTNFVRWNENTEFCRDFNDKLRCTILEQLHCHSDKDQMALSFSLYVVLRQMIERGSTMAMEYDLQDGDNEKTKYQGTTLRWPIDDFFSKEKHDLNLVIRNDNNNNITTTKGTKTIRANARNLKHHDVVQYLASQKHWARK